MSCYCQLGKHVGNSLGTYSKHIVNNKNPKNPKPFCLPPLKKWYGMKHNCYKEHLGRMRNTLRVHWEFIEIMVGTHCEQ
jgi:hypothetical protein